MCSARTGSGSGTCGIERVRRHRSQPTRFEILEGLRDLAAGVHHEGPVVLDRLPDGPAPEDQDLEVAGPGILRVVGPERDEVPAPNVTSCPLVTGRPSLPTRPDPARR